MIHLTNFSKSSSFFVLFLVLVVAGCSGVSRSALQGSLGVAPIEEAYRAAFGDIPAAGNWLEQSDAEVPSPVAMALERSACYGTCPEYTLAFNDSGDGCYCGRKNIDMVGCYKGRVEPELIRQIARAARSSGLLRLPPGFFTFTTDEPSTFTFLRVGDQVLLTKNYANAGPPSLWVIEQLLDSLWPRVDWHKADTQDSVSCVEEILGAEWRGSLPSP